MTVPDAGIGRAGDAKLTNGREDRKNREDVVRAAGRLFAERGFHGTSMRDLGGELGMLGSSLYSHIGGKDELLLEVIGRGAAMFQEVADEVLAAEIPATEQLRRLIEGHVGIVVGNIDVARTFLNEARFLGDAEHRRVVEMRDRYERAYRTVLERGRTAGEFPRVADPRLAAIFILSILNSVDRWYRPDGGVTPEELAADIHRFVLDGLG
jgi:AcrR family transcriptional regulator